ncbi:MAG: hypothetical protein IJF34_10510, partial [Clostridia bacterium]|nr:hypothetical protein [Clostridia bacterium]
VDRIPQDGNFLPKANLHTVHLTTKSIYLYYTDFNSKINPVFAENSKKEWPLWKPFSLHCPTGTQLPLQAIPPP